jgi:hypothetical protein
MPEGTLTSGSKAWGETEIRKGDGSLLVAFSSKDAEGFWGNLYQAERIRYCMRHRNDDIPMYLRTGERPPLSIEEEARRLWLINLLGAWT